MRNFLPGALGLLAACGAPLSNQVLYEDEVFLAALPSEDRLHSPSEVRLARVGDSRLLEQAVGAAAAYDELVKAIVASGEALRTTPPDERSDVLRSWKPVDVATKIDGDSYIWSVRAEVIQPSGGDDVEWTLEVSLDGDAPWTEVGRGTHDPDGAGDFTWDLAVHAGLYGLQDEVPGVLSFDYQDAFGELVRDVTVSEDIPVGLPLQWQLVSEEVFIWVGDLTITDDELTWPGGAQVWHQEGNGGRGFGTVITGDGEQEFEICWDWDGNDVWVDGAPLTEIGQSNDCTVDPF